jgi:hypothetical protein
VVGVGWGVRGGCWASSSVGMKVMVCLVCVGWVVGGPGTSTALNLNNCASLDPTN